MVVSKGLAVMKCQRRLSYWRKMDVLRGELGMGRGSAVVVGSQGSLGDEQRQECASEVPTVSYAEMELN